MINRQSATCACLCLCRLPFVVSYGRLFAFLLIYRIDRDQRATNVQRPLINKNFTPFELQFAFRFDVYFNVLFVRV